MYACMFACMPACMCVYVCVYIYIYRYFIGNCVLGRLGDMRVFCIGMHRYLWIVMCFLSYYY